MAQIKKYDSPAERQKAYRERKRNAPVDANVTLHRVWTEGIGERLMTLDEIRQMMHEQFPSKD